MTQDTKKDNLSPGEARAAIIAGNAPDNLTVGGGLDLSGTQITALPDNLTVGGGLDLSGTQITALPDNLTVGGGLYLNGTQITALPDNLTVGGGLDLRGTQITALPDNLTVGGWLYLSGTQIDQLAKGPNCPKLVITGSQHNIREAEEGWGIFAGCEEFDLEWWEDEGNVEMLGNKHEYSEDEIKEYLVYVRFLLAMQRQRIAATQTEESDD